MRKARANPLSTAKEEQTSVSSTPAVKRVAVCLCFLQEVAKDTKPQTATTTAQTVSRYSRRAGQPKGGCPHDAAAKDDRRTLYKFRLFLWRTPIFVCQSFHRSAPRLSTFLTLCPFAAIIFLHYTINPRAGKASDRKREPSISCLCRPLLFHHPSVQTKSRFAALFLCGCATKRLDAPNSFAVGCIFFTG